MFLSSEDIFSSSLIWRIQSYFGVEKVKCIERSKNKKWKTIKLESNQKIEDVPTDDNIIYYKVNTFWYYFFLIGTQLGEEPFCAFFFSYWFWNLDASIGRRLILVWNLMMYIGQFLKDVVQYERPRMPVVVRLQTKWAEEFGLPSTHAMVGLAVPTAAFYLTLEKFSLPLSVVLLITTVWVFMVSSSRMFLGMHSLADILAGLLLSAVLLPPILYLVCETDEFLVISPVAPLLSLSASLLALMSFPSTPPHHWSPSATTAVDVLGCYQGVQLGQWCLFRLGIVQISYSSFITSSIPGPDMTTAVLSTARVLTGGVLAAVVRQLVKSATRSFTKYATNDRSRQNIIIFSKFVTWLSVCFSVVFISPLLFMILGIQRESFFTEYHLIK